MAGARRLRAARNGNVQPLGKRLSSRLEEYAGFGDLSETDHVVEYLCSNFPEYRRQKVGQFTKMVARVSASVIEEMKIKNIEDQHRGQWQRNHGDICSSASAGEWSPQGGHSNNTGTSGGDELASDNVMDDNDDGNERLNSSLRDLYGVTSMQERLDAPQDRSTVPGESSAHQKDEKGNTTEDPNLRGRLGKRTRTSLTHSNGNHANGDSARTVRTQKQQQQERENATLRTVKHEKKRMKKIVADSKHLTLSKTNMTVPKDVRYKDLGGLDDVLRDIKELIEFPLKHPEVYEWLGVQPPRGVLLHGPPGCGKTALANAIANECNVPFFKVSAPEIVSGMSGESESRIRALFQDAAAAAPCIIFIDEIDAIAQKREHAQREMERRIVAQMLTCLDDLSAQTTPEETNLVGDVDGPGGSGKVDEQQKGAQNMQLTGQHVIVLGATNRPDTLDSALRRAGRFDREIAMGIPTEAARLKILHVMCSKLRLDGDFDFQTIARKTPGYVGADLEALTKEAAAIAISRIFKHIEEKEILTQPHPEMQQLSTWDGDLKDVEVSRPKMCQSLGEEELQGLAMKMEDFVAAVGKVQPSIRREGFTTTPDVTWSDVGSLEEIREELSFTITQPILHPERFRSLGIAFACGVLLCGPPGCGKTLVAKAIANEAGANFISIKGPELLNKYVGESERAVRQLFSRARAAKPCVLFFDEMDALAPRRGSDNQSAERVVNQLLTEMDGVDSRDGVYLVGATNRPDIIDPALLRPGRLDKMLYVPLPDLAGRVSILRALLRNKPLVDKIDVGALGMDPRCEGFSGADLAALVREACILALKGALQKDGDVEPKVEKAHFYAALKKVKPSVSPVDRKMYDNLRSNLKN